MSFGLVNRSILLALLLLPRVSITPAQQKADVGSDPSDPLNGPADTVVVVGSHIDGAPTEAALPVTVITPEKIAAIGAVSGDDLMRAIPQMGNATFNDANDQQTSNAARGDVASIDLRGAGLGDTLVLLNGRRIVEHPTSQSRGGVPLISYNAQSIPTAGVQRLEVLREGASAIYGADAVAGVVNVVTPTNVDGVRAGIQYGTAEGTHREEGTASVVAGHDIDSQRGNISLIFSAYHRTPQLPSDEPFTATQDLRGLFANAPGYNSSSAPDGRGNQSSFPALVARAANGGNVTAPLLQGATQLTTTAGSFHVQPNTLSGCVTQLGQGLCAARGSVPYATTANALRYDSNALDAVTISPEVERQNVSLNAHYDVSRRLTVYSQVDYYDASSHGLTTQPTALVPIGVAATNFFNPLGPVTFANGTANPNRLANLTNVPATGLPVAFATYRFNDLGPANVDVQNFQDRFLIGLKGRLGGFNYDSALLYGEARVVDVSDGIDSTLLAKQLAVSTPDAYNPFNGGCLDGSGGRDCTPSSQAALDAVRLRLRRTSTSALTNIDFKLDRPDLVRAWAGDVGVAFGVEARRETHSDVRDPHVNGAITFTDPVLHTFSVSDAVGVSSTPSTSDSRTVSAAFSEVEIPLVAPDLGVPFARRVDVQIAGRLEHYSDFGSIARPKVAMVWDVVRGVRVRATWGQGFKAPNLETTAPYTYGRAQTVTDWYRCQAALNKGALKNFSACTENFGVTYNESGNPRLGPETSSSYDIGVVLQLSDIPDAWGSFSLAVDRWRLRQVGIVGVVGEDAIAVEDYLNRAKGGAGSANLVRLPATADDIAFFSGSGLTPVGTPVSVNDTFKNLQPKTTAGVDVSLDWKDVTATAGAFDVDIDATHLDEISQPPSPELQLLYDARAAGTINAATPLGNPGDQLQVLGNPKWKATATLTWTLAPFQVGGSVIYTGSTLDTGLLSNSGVPWRVASLTTINLYGQFSLDASTAIHELRIRAGVKNIFDRSPPLESDGYNGALYVPYGRYVYASIGVSL